MWINNQDDISKFEETINKCKDSVYVITPSGKEYDLKETKGYYLGLASMLNANDYEEPEVYASCNGDEQLLLRYLSDKESALKAS